MDIVSDVKLHLQLVNLSFLPVGTIGIGGGGKQKITGVGVEISKQSTFKFYDSVLNFH